MFRLGRGLALTSFRRDWLTRDIVAGVVLTTLLVPQGMAYAELAGLPPITGLYTSITCLLGYAAFGPSRILVLGPDSSLGPGTTTLRAEVPDQGALSGLMDRITGLGLEVIDMHLVAPFPGD